MVLRGSVAGAARVTIVICEEGWLEEDVLVGGCGLEVENTGRMDVEDSWMELGRKRRDRDRVRWLCLKCVGWGRSCS